MKLTELKDKKLTELKEIAKQMNIEKSSSMSKDDLINAISSSSSKILTLLSIFEFLSFFM